MGLIRCYCTKLALQHIVSLDFIGAREVSIAHLLDTCPAAHYLTQIAEPSESQSLTDITTVAKSTVVQQEGSCTHDLQPHVARLFDLAGTSTRNLNRMIMCVPLDVEPSDAWLVCSDLSDKPVVQRRARWRVLCFQLVGIVLCVDVVANAHELVPAVRGCEKDDRDTDQVSGRNC